MRENCIICELPINRNGITKTKRPHFALTCSPSCTVIFNRVYSYLKYYKRKKNGHE